MFSPDDPLAPPAPAFEEPWQAQALALADTMVRAGVFSASDWAEALGAELRSAEAAGKADTLETYFAAVVRALELLTPVSTELSEADLARRKSEWRQAYLNTPHGQPVRLGAENRESTVP